MRKAIFFSFFILLFILWHSTYGQEVKRENNQSKLNEILEKTTIYCERLKKKALFFVCHENIKEKTNHYDRKRVYRRIESSGEHVWTTDLKLRRAKTNSYLYDYQLIKKEKEIKETRILLKENGKEKHEKNAKLKIKRYTSKFLVYGPVGFLSRYWQQHFNYELISQDCIDGKKAVVISAVPKAPREENYNFGRIWVDEDDFSILKIEWDPKSIKNYEEKIPSSIGDLKRNLTWTVSYGVEKKGIKFPSKQFIEEVITSHADKKHPKYIVNIIYENYKFFTVETEVKWR